MKKKIIAISLAVCLLVGVCIGFFTCSLYRAPKVEEIYDRVVELVEASYELNTVFYGAGLPVYKTDSLYAEFSHLYFDFPYRGQYEMVSQFSTFAAIDEIKLAAQRVYSAAYLEKVLYPAAFDGYAMGDGVGGTAFAVSRYLEENDWIYQSTEDNHYLMGMRVYDYSTMKVVKPSRSNACYVEMLTWLDDAPDIVSTVRLRLVLQDDGEWYLDSFTG